MFGLFMQLFTNSKKAVFLGRWSADKSVKSGHQKCEQELGVGYCDYTAAAVERDTCSVL